MKLNQRQMWIIGGGVLVVLVGFWLFMSSLRSNTAPPAVTLKVWGTDQQAYYTDIINAYRTVRPNVTVEYTAVSAAGYEEKILNALASGKGPDVFMLNAHDVWKEKDKLAPAAVSQFPLSRLKELFPTTVEQDVAVGESIYALPLYIDTLALIYNQDAFDTEGIVSPPRTWNEFQDDAIRLRALNDAGQIVKAGAALGGSRSTIANATDIVYALLLQGDAITSNVATGEAQFNYERAVEAFNFYLRFADGASGAYTWNDSLPIAEESFAAGKTSMMLGYKSDVQAIKKKSPFIPVGIAELPQLAGASRAVTYADYQGLAVSKQAEFPEWGWDFVIFATTDEPAHAGYLKGSARPPAMRAEISKRLDSTEDGVFAKQALTARSWVQVDAAKIADIFNGSITGVLQGKIDSAKAIRQAQEQIYQLTQ